MDNCKDLRVMVNKHKQKKKKTFRTYGKSNRELNAQNKKFIKNKKRRKTKKSFSTSKKCRFLTMKVEKVSPAQ